MPGLINPATVSDTMPDLRQLGTTQNDNTYNSQRWYIAGMAGQVSANLTGTSASVVGTYYAMPYWTGRAATIEQAFFRVSTAVAASTAHVGVYANLGNSLYPGSRIGVTADVATTSNGTFVGSNNLAWNVGKRTLVWIVYQASAAIVVNTLPTTVQWPLLGHSLDTNYSIPGNYWQVTGVYGALPDPFPTTATTGTAFTTVPAVWLRPSA